MSALAWRWLGRVDHASAVQLQEHVREKILSGEDASILLLCEHDPVVTMGRSANPDNLLSDAARLEADGVALRQVSRGGDYTFHGPGQLMVYPVIRLRSGIVAYLEAVAGALGQLAAILGVDGAHWRRDPAGLWLGDRKLAACGIHLRRRVTIHGFAFNVSTPETAWRHVVPCGLAHGGVTSIARERALRGLGPAPSVEEAAKRLAPLLARALDTVRERALPCSHGDQAETH